MIQNTAAWDHNQTFFYWAIRITQMLGTGLAGLPNVDCMPDCDTKPDYPSEGEYCDCPEGEFCD